MSLHNSPRSVIMIFLSMRVCRKVPGRCMNATSCLWWASRALVKNTELVVTVGEAAFSLQLYSLCGVPFKQVHPFIPPLFYSFRKINDNKAFFLSFCVRVLGSHGKKVCMSWSYFISFSAPFLCLTPNRFSPSLRLNCIILALITGSSSSDTRIGVTKSIDPMVKCICPTEKCIPPTKMLIVSWYQSGGCTCLLLLVSFGFESCCSLSSSSPVSLCPCRMTVLYHPAPGQQMSRHPQRPIPEGTVPCHSCCLSRCSQMAEDLFLRCLCPLPYALFCVGMIITWLWVITTPPPLCPSSSQPMYLTCSNSSSSPAFAMAAASHSFSVGCRGVSSEGMLDSKITPGISLGISGNADGSGSSVLFSISGSGWFVCPLEWVIVPVAKLQPTVLFILFPHHSTLPIILSGLAAQWITIFLLSLWYPDPGSNNICFWLVPGISHFWTLAPVC